MKFVLVLYFIYLATSAYAAVFPYPGYDNISHSKEAKYILSNALEALAATEKGPFYTLYDLNNAISEPLDDFSGMKYVLDADLQDLKTDQINHCGVILMLDFYINIPENSKIHNVMRVEIKCLDKEDVVRSLELN